MIQPEATFHEKLDTYRQAYAALFALLPVYPALLRDLQGACGVWSARQVIAHFSGWHEIALRWHDDLDAGITGRRYMESGDTYNDEQVAKRAHLTWGETIDEVRGWVERFTARMQALPPEKANDAQYHRWVRLLGSDCLRHTQDLLTFWRNHAEPTTPTAAPILEFDPTPRAMIEATDHPSKTFTAIPERCVLCFFQEVIAEMREQHSVTYAAELRSEIGAHPVYVLERDGQRIVVAHPGVGAPLAVGILEELIALGCKQFIAVGGAGSLKKDLVAGHAVVPTAAVRDDGTSYHYAPPSREITPDAAVVAAVRRALDAHHVPYVAGKTWTTDALYRETPGRVAARRDEGCLTVEMEAAAFFAAAKFRGVQFGQLLYCGDDLSGDRWDHRDWIKGQLTTRAKLFWVAVEACLAL